MWEWALFSIIFLSFLFLYLWWKRIFRVHQQQLEEKDNLLREREHIIEESKQKNAFLEAKYLKKVRTDEERKINLEKYHQKHRDIRKGLQETIEAAIENREKWIPHARKMAQTGKLGKPKGAHGGGRSRPEIVDKAIHVIPTVCPTCKVDLSDRTACVSHTHVFTDLENLQLPGHEYKALTLMNTMLVIYRRKCLQCQKWISPDSGPLKFLRYGLNFVCYVISKRIDTRMPFEILVDELCTQFGASLTLSAPTIVNWFKRHESLLRELYAQMKKIVLLLSHVHVDETGLPMKGKNWWTWVICNEVFVWFWQSHTRGHQAVEHILKDFQGVIESDCWGAYNKLDSEQQKCLAHLVTDLKEILYRLGKESEEIESKVSEQAQEQNQPDEHVNAQQSPQKEPLPSFPLRKRGRPKKQTLKMNPLAVSQIKAALETKRITMNQTKRIKDFLGESWGNGPRGWQTSLDKRISKQDAEQQFLQMIQALRDEGITDPRLNRVIDRGEKYLKSLFTYLAHEGIEPDNNEAERDLRSMVVQRKVSGSYKNPCVSEVYHLLKSISVTCRKNDKDFQTLHLRLLSGEKVDLSQYFFK